MARPVDVSKHQLWRQRFERFHRSKLTRRDGSCEAADGLKPNLLERSASFHGSYRANRDVTVFVSNRKLPCFPIGFSASIAGQ